MQRPPLTRLEVAAVLRREVYRYVSLGVPKPAAIERVAQEQWIDAEWVAQLVDSVDGPPRGEA